MPGALMNPCGNGSSLDGASWIGSLIPDVLIRVPTPTMDIYVSDPDCPSVGSHFFPKLP